MLLDDMNIMHTNSVHVHQGNCLQYFHSLIFYPYLKSLCDLKVDKAGAEDIGEDHLECLPVLKPGVKIEALNADRLAVLDFQGLEAGLQGLKVQGKHQVGAGVDQDPRDLIETHWH